LFTTRSKPVSPSSLASTSSRHWSSQNLDCDIGLISPDPGKGGWAIGDAFEHHQVISAAGKPVGMQQADGAGGVGNKGFGMGSRHDVSSFRDKCGSFHLVWDLPDLRGCLSHSSSTGRGGNVRFSDHQPSRDRPVRSRAKRSYRGFEPSLEKNMNTQLKRKIAFALSMGVITTGIISFVLLALNFGFSKGFAGTWLRSWSIAYLIVIPAILLIGPRLQAQVDRLID
jgi:hypothetical protein